MALSGTWLGCIFPCEYKCSWGLVGVNVLLQFLFYLFYFFS